MSLCRKFNKTVSRSGRRACPRSFHTEPRVLCKKHWLTLIRLSLRHGRLRKLRILAEKRRRPRHSLFLQGRFYLQRIYHRLPTKVVIGNNVRLLSFRRDLFNPRYPGLQLVSRVEVVVAIVARRLFAKPVLVVAPVKPDVAYLRSR